VSPQDKRFKEPLSNVSGRSPADARDPAAKFPPITPLRPPTGAPNVLVVLIDDVCFGASSAFGGPINTSTASGWRRAT
jgi:hypothetical protein